MRPYLPPISSRPAITLCVGVAIIITAMCTVAATISTDDIVISNRLTQTAASVTNTFDGHLTVEGDLTVESALRVPRQGDVEMGSFTNGSPFGGASSAVDGSSSSSAVTPSYIYGCWADYSNSTSVVISVGEGYCSGSYFHLTNEVTVTVSGVSEPMVYFYIDDSASTYPNGVQFTFTTNAPSFDTQRMGWYLGDDRVVSAALVNSSDELWTYDRGEHGTYKFRNWAWTSAKVLSGGNPSGAWQATTTAVSSMVPTNARIAHLWISSADSAPDTACINVAAAEYADQGTAQLEGAREYGKVSTAVEVELGPSCNVKWAADDNDWDGYSKVVITGWRAAR